MSLTSPMALSCACIDLPDAHAVSGGENTGLQTVPGNSASVTISAEGITILTYFATDNAGNQETAKTLTVRIDKTPPVISGLPTPGCSIWPPNHKVVQVALVTATDTLSGLAPGSFSVTGTSDDPANGQILITGGPTQFRVFRECLSGRHSKRAKGRSLQQYPRKSTDDAFFSRPTEISRPISRPTASKIGGFSGDF